MGKGLLGSLGHTETRLHPELRTLTPNPQVVLGGTGQWLRGPWEAWHCHPRAHTLAGTQLWTHVCSRAHVLTRVYKLHVDFKNVRTKTNGFECFSKSTLARSLPDAPDPGSQQDGRLWGTLGGPSPPPPPSTQGRAGRSTARGHPGPRARGRRGLHGAWAAAASWKVSSARGVLAAPVRLLTLGGSGGHSLRPRLSPHPGSVQGSWSPRPVLPLPPATSR